MCVCLWVTIGYLGWPCNLAELKVCARCLLVGNIHSIGGILQHSGRYQVYLNEVQFKINGAWLVNAGSATRSSVADSSGDNVADAAWMVGAW
jgi:hypothetical protein